MRHLSVQTNHMLSPSFCILKKKKKKRISRRQEQTEGTFLPPCFGTRSKPFEPVFPIFELVLDVRPVELTLLGSYASAAKEKKYHKCMQLRESKWENSSEVYKNDLAASQLVLIVQEQQLGLVLANPLYFWLPTEKEIIDNMLTIEVTFQ